MDNVKSVSLGNGHSGALTEDGELYMWGNNAFKNIVDKKGDGKVLKVSKIGSFLNNMLGKKKK